MARGSSVAEADLTVLKGTITFEKLVFAGCMLLILSAGSNAQLPSPTDVSPSNQLESASETESDRWNLYYQATSIGDSHGTFHSPYKGPLSLQPYPEHLVSLTTTFFFTASPLKDTY